MGDHPGTALTVSITPCSPPGIDCGGVLSQQALDPPTTWSVHLPVENAAALPERRHKLMAQTRSLEAVRNGSSCTDGEPLPGGIPLKSDNRNSQSGVWFFLRDCARQPQIDFERWCGHQYHVRVSLATVEHGDCRFPAAPRTRGPPAMLIRRLEFARHPGSLCRLSGVQAMRPDATAAELPTVSQPPSVRLPYCWCGTWHGFLVPQRATAICHRHERKRGSRPRYGRSADP